VEVLSLPRTSALYVQAFLEGPISVLGSEENILSRLAVLANTLELPATTGKELSAVATAVTRWLGSHYAKCGGISSWGTPLLR
jgi:hypothetical protein